MKLLLVDDDADDRSFFTEAIHQIDPGIHLDLAANGLEALQKLHASQQKPDLVFLDINMPVMDGCECLRRIRENVTTRDLKVVICSTSSDLLEINRTRQLGATYIRKPGSFKELVNLLQQHIRSATGKQNVSVSL